MRVIPEIKRRRVEKQNHGETNQPTNKKKLDRLIKPNARKTALNDFETFSSLDNRSANNETIQNTNSTMPTTVTRYIGQAE